MKTIALFGGSFDPPHIGHESIAKAALNFKDVEKVIVMPTYLNPFKSVSHNSYEKRFQWLNDIFKDNKNIEVSRFEINKKKKVPSIITVKHLLKRYKKIYLIIGADNLSTLKEWHRYKELKECVTFVVASRDNIPIPKSYLTLNVDKKISSTQIRRNKLQTRIKNIIDVLDKNKAESIEVFDLKNKDYIVDYAIIASSLGPRHTLALLEHLKKGIKPAEAFNNVDESGDWVVIDLGDILIHIMTPQYRVKYDMETFLNEIGNDTSSL
ncbi:MAG: nicotinate (nicotinamide) nucleotide adenylyltransferase [Sulfurimonas sp.]|nr:nicotinate (nicotinamide) nucleotide adenylyltransferase [Sulfurimonas sp.]